MYKKGMRSGVVLLIVLVLLVLLSMLGYTVSSRVLAKRHRDNYIINYTSARYGCDSAMKYAIVNLARLPVPQVVYRPNEPDFSDLFSTDEEEYETYLREWMEWAEEQGLNREDDDFLMDGELGPNFEDDFADSNLGDVNRLFGMSSLFGTDVNNPNDPNMGPVDFWSIEGSEANLPDVRGPYGPDWPLIAKPLNFKVGEAEIEISIEDENAKYPLGWVLLNEKDIQKEIEAGFEIFCEWMDMNSWEISAVFDEVKEIDKIKTFQMTFKPIKLTEKKTVTRTISSRGKPRQVTSVRPVTTTIAASTHTGDFAKLFNSSLLDKELLARPTVLSDKRQESALKYLGIWGSNKVNINTAPRHVLEAALIFGGDEVEIADEIIQMRRHKPFKDLADLKKRLFGYSVSIKKCERFITTVSNHFTLRITSTCGKAQSTAIMTVRRNGKAVENLYVLTN